MGKHVCYWLRYLGSSVLCLWLAACAQLAQLNPAGIPQYAVGVNTDRGLIIDMESIFFDFDSVKLDAEALAKIADLAKLVKRESQQNYIIGIDGYTDIVGQENYNLNLSQRRADMVKAAFIKQGIKPQRLDSKGFGQADPIADNTTANGRQQNRRVEVLILQPADIPRQDQP